MSLLGVDFTQASVSERETLSLDPAAARALLTRLTACHQVTEAAVLATCNRTELYFVGDEGAAEHVLAQMRTSCTAAQVLIDGRRLRQERGDAVLRHLFSLAAGTESAILGDGFIVRQMKQALRTAGEAGSLGPVLSRAFRQAFSVGDRARRQTDIARGESSLGAVAAAVIARRFAPTCRVLLVGAGTTAREIARQLAKRRVGVLTIVNRTAEGALSLARDCGGHAGRWEDLVGLVRAADVVICATAARVPIVSGEMLGTNRPLLIDIGVPRNIAPPPAVHCLTVDDLAARQEEARARRARAMPMVERLVDEEMDRWHRWMQGRTVEPLLKALFQSEAEARQRVVAEMVARGWVDSTDAADGLVGRWSGEWLRRHAAELRAWADTEHTEGTRRRTAGRPACEVV